MSSIRECLKQALISKRRRLGYMALAAFLCFFNLHSTAVAKPSPKKSRPAARQIKVPADGYSSYAQAYFNAFCKPGDYYVMGHPSDSMYWFFRVFKLKSDSTFETTSFYSWKTGDKANNGKPAPYDVLRGMYTRSGNRLTFEVSAWNGAYRPTGVIQSNGNLTTGVSTLGIGDPLNWKRR